MDAGRRHKTPGSETNDRVLLIAITVARILAFCFVSPRLNWQRKM